MAEKKLADYCNGNVLKRTGIRPKKKLPVMHICMCVEMFRSTFETSKTAHVLKSTRYNQNIEHMKIIYCIIMF